MYGWMGEKTDLTDCLAQFKIYFHLQICMYSFHKTIIFSYLVPSFTFVLLFSLPMGTIAKYWVGLSIKLVLLSENQPSSLLQHNLPNFPSTNTNISTRQFCLNYTNNLCTRHAATLLKPHKKNRQFG
jgi:hypothetical protein